MARGRPPKVERMVEIRPTIPEELKARVDLLLFSPLEGRVPYGKLGELVSMLLQEHLDKLAQQEKGKHDA